MKTQGEQRARIIRVLAILVAIGRALVLIPRRIREREPDPAHAVEPAAFRRLEERSDGLEDAVGGFPEDLRVPAIGERILAPESRRPFRATTVRQHARPYAHSSPESRQENSVGDFPSAESK